MIHIKDKIITFENFEPSIIIGCIRLEIINDGFVARYNDFSEYDVYYNSNCKISRLDGPAKIYYKRDGKFSEVVKEEYIINGMTLDMVKRNKMISILKASKTDILFKYITEEYPLNLVVEKRIK